jgi:hypothetical protein
VDPRPCFADGGARTQPWSKGLRKEARGCDAPKDEGFSPFVPCLICSALGESHTPTARWKGWGDLEEGEVQVGTLGELWDQNLCAPEEKHESSRCDKAASG